MSSDQHKRNSIRFKPDHNTLVYIKKLNKAGETQIDCIGLVTNEAGKGFGCIVLKDNFPDVDSICIVKVGELSPLPAKVVYANAIDPDAVKLGFEFQE